MGLRKNLWVLLVPDMFTDQMPFLPPNQQRQTLKEFIIKEQPEFFA